jgi:hypothetical protein
MITQEIKQGDNVIRIENAESLEDAKKHKFKEGVFNRYFVNNKPVDNYMVLIKYIIEETKKNGQAFIPEQKKLNELRKDMFVNRNNAIKQQLEELKEHCQSSDLNLNVLKSIDEMIDKIDDSGVRVVE